MVKFSSYHDYLLHKYQNGGGFKKDSIMLLSSARRMLECAKIVANIDNAVTINKILNRYSKGGIPRGQGLQDYMNLVSILNSYYE